MVSPSDSYSDAKDFLKQAEIAKICVYGLSILSAVTFLFLPLFNLLHPSPWQRWMGAVHGLAAMVATIVAVYTGHLAFPLLRGANKILPQLRTLTFWTTVLALLSIISGNWAYMRYRAPIGGARAWLQANSPLVHNVFMEYHEFTVLFTVPLGTACAWILWQYGDSIVDKKNTPVLAATSIALMAIMFFALGGLVTGIGIAKIHSL